MGTLLAIFGWLISNPTILAIIAGVVGAFGWGWKRERAGAAKERAKREAADRMVEDIGNQVDNDIGALTPEQRRERLRQWAKS